MEPLYLAPEARVGLVPGPDQAKTGFHVEGAMVDEMSTEARPLILGEASRSAVPEMGRPHFNGQVESSSEHQNKTDSADYDEHKNKGLGHSGKHPSSAIEPRCRPQTPDFRL